MMSENCLSVKRAENVSMKCFPILIFGVAFDEFCGIIKEC